MSGRSISVDDDPVLVRARRVLADVARIMRQTDGTTADVVPDTVARRRIVALAADLEILVRVLTSSRDALGLELAARMRQSNAISAYGQVGAITRQYVRETRRRTRME